MSFISRRILPIIRSVHYLRRDPKKALRDMQDKLKKLKDSASRDHDPKNNKYYIGFLVYLGACGLLYELKKQHARPITHQQTFDAIKKSQIDVIYVVKDTDTPKPSKEEGNETLEASLEELKNTQRKIYMKIDGVEYVTHVPQIDLFYQRLKQVEKSKSQKVHIIEKNDFMIDREFKRVAKAIMGVVMPLVFPILLYNSSAGKLLKTKFLGLNEGFRPTIKFKDIAGLGNAKIEISQLVDFLRFPGKYKQIGAKVPKGALLSGPPGTGKTMLAKACAGEANVPFFSVSGSQFVELYAGMGATRVRDLFKNAKKQTPAIIFIDEIDAIGRKREDKFGGAHDERANTLNQLLVEMDGFGTSDDIIILAATNRKEMLDSALTRPGRFDRMVEIDLPDIKGRQEILEIYLDKIKLSPTQTIVDYAKRLATLTYGFSGADLANLCNQAAILAVRRSKDFVEPNDFQSASDRVLAGLEQNLTLNKEEKKKIAYHEAGHAVVAWFSEGASPLLKITIVPRSKGSLGFAQYLPNESSLMNRQQLLDQICVILGGRTSQEIFFDEVSSGASDDLMKVRRMARAMILRFGMSQSFPNYAPIETDGENIFSQATNAKLDQEVTRVVAQCTKMTRKSVEKHRDKIKALAEAVLEKESLNHQEIKAILGQRPFEVKENYKQFLEHSSETAKRAEVIA